MSKEYFQLKSFTSKINFKPKGSISYDIKDSWVVGLSKLGYEDISLFLKNNRDMSKPERMKYLRIIEREKYPNLFSDMEIWWLGKLNKFIEINSVLKSDYISHYYDEITLKSSASIKSLIIDGIVFSKEKN